MERNKRVLCWVFVLAAGCGLDDASSGGSAGELAGNSSKADDTSGSDLPRDMVTCVEGVLAETSSWGARGSHVILSKKCQNAYGEEIECACSNFYIFGSNSCGLYGEGEGTYTVGDYVQLMNSGYVYDIIQKNIGRRARLCPNPLITPILDFPGEYCDVNLASNDQGISVILKGYSWEWEGNTLVIENEGTPVEIPADEVTILEGPDCVDACEKYKECEELDEEGMEQCVAGCIHREWWTPEMLECTVSTDGSDPETCGRALDSCFCSDACAKLARCEGYLQADDEACLDRCRTEWSRQSITCVLARDISESSTCGYNLDGCFE